MQEERLEQEEVPHLLVIMSGTEMQPKLSGNPKFCSFEYFNGIPLKCALTVFLLV